MYVGRVPGALQQIKLLHWQTKSYARHKAYDDIYHSLGDLVDKFVEMYMGKYGRVGPIRAFSKTRIVSSMPPGKNA